MSDMPPMIRAVYQKDGTRVAAPTGFPGPLCHAVTAPYDARHQGQTTTVPTEEADLPLVRQTVTEAQREQV